MAERFGGRFSPDPKLAADAPATGRHPFDGRKRSAAGFRTNLLFVLPFMFLLPAFTGAPIALALNLACFGLLLLAAWLTREGVLAQQAYDARKVARRPAIPRKLFGSALTGLGLACAGFGDGSMMNAVVFGVVGTILHALSFGPDPLRDKGMSSGDRFQSDRVAHAVEEAEKHLSDMRAAIGRAGDRPLEARVERFSAIVRDMFRTVEADPRDLTTARKFLGVYLLAARDATDKFAEFYGRTRDPEARKDYAELLDELESKFTAKTQTLLLDNRTDLDVEIEVLRQRLERENL
jgi:hypothetical protein